MAAPKGNQFWKARSKHGRKPIFESPEQLLEAAYEYFAHVDDNPMVTYKPMIVSGEVQQVDQVHKLPYTEGGLCIFLDISMTCWCDYCSKDDFSDITKQIKEIIRNQKLSGASANIFNANIIARDLGLKDAQTSEVSGPDGGAIETKWTIEVIDSKGD